MSLQWFKGARECVDGVDVWTDGDLKPFTGAPTCEDRIRDLLRQERAIVRVEVHTHRAEILIVYRDYMTRIVPLYVVGPDETKLDEID